MAAVLDSSAMLAMLFKEPGARLVASKISDAAISTVNLAEVVSKLIDEGFAPAEARRTAHSIPMQVHLFDTESAVQTGLLRAATRAHGLSLGDRACLALAARLEVEAITADRAWSGADVGVDIRLIR